MGLCRSGRVEGRGARSALADQGGEIDERRGGLVQQDQPGQGAGGDADRGEGGQPRMDGIEEYLVKKGFSDIKEITGFINRPD